MTALQVTSDPVRVATEGALWGAVADHGFLHEAVPLRTKRSATATA